MKSVACLFLLAASAFAGPFHRVPRVYVGGGWGWGYYGPAYWGPAYYPAYGYSPGWFGGYSYRPGLGEIKLNTESRDAEVFLDGSYAGVAKDLKSIWLRPGSYDLEVRPPGRPSFFKRVYVLSGKTLKIDTRDVRP